MKLRPLSKPSAKFMSMLAATGGARAVGGASAPASARSAASPRPVIRGESGKREAQQTIVDWLRFTFLPEGGFGDALEDLRKYFALWFSVPVNLVPCRRGFRGYADSHELVAWVDGELVRIAVVGLGGDSVGNTVIVDMSGRGCAVVSDWKAVYATLQGLDARITRCDLAMDFCEGQVAIGQVEELYFSGEFNAGGRIPKYRRIEGGVAGSGACGGKTFEIGRRVNGKMLRAYEKGRQLGKQDSDWLRIEIEFGNKDRTLVHEIVLETDRFFVGAYKALEQFLDADPLKCRTDQREAVAEEEEIVVERKLHWMWQQHGKLVHFWLTHNDEDAAGLVTRVRREGVPAQLHKPALARHVYGAHEPAPSFGE